MEKIETHVTVIPKREARESMSEREEVRLGSELEITQSSSPGHENIYHVTQSPMGPGGLSLQLAFATENALGLTEQVLLSVCMHRLRLKLEAQGDTPDVPTMQAYRYITAAMIELHNLARSEFFRKQL